MADIQVQTLLHSPNNIIDLKFNRLKELSKSNPQYSSIPKNSWQRRHQQVLDIIRKLD